MTKRRKWILAGVIAAVVVVAVIASLGGSSVPVEVATVQRDSVRVVVAEEGQTRIRDSYVLAAPVGGRLERIDLDEGENVAQGDVIARLFPTPAGTRERDVSAAQLAAAEARRLEIASRLEEARARVAQAEREAARRTELADSGIIAREAMERAQLEATSARRQLDALQASLRAAEADVASARAALSGVAPSVGAGEPVPVRAPAAGRVLRVFEESERIVAPGTPLVEVGDSRGLEAVVNVLTADAVRITPGAPVQIDEWGGGYPVHGRVQRVEPSAFTEVSALGVQEQRVNVIIDLIDPPEALGAGYRVEAEIVTWEGEALAIPTSALFQRGGEWHTFAVVDGRAQLRPLQLGQRSTELAEVLDGLAEGDRVILFPSDEVADGVAVQGGEDGG